MQNEGKGVHTVASLNDAVNKLLRREPMTVDSVKAAAQKAAGTHNRFFGIEKEHAESQIAERARRRGLPVFRG